MKKISLLLLLGFVFCSCGNLQGGNTGKTKTDDGADSSGIAVIQDSITVNESETNQNVEQWLKSVRTVTKWYQDNVPGYQKHINKLIECPLLKWGVRDDCSGLLTACLQYYGVLDDGTIYNSGDFCNKDGRLGKIMCKSFTPIPCLIKQDEEAFVKHKLQPGDILVCHDGKDYNHVTVYAGDGRFYDWGSKAPGPDAKTPNPSVEDNWEQPVSGNIDDNMMNYHIYTLIWRCKE